MGGNYLRKMPKFGQDPKTPKIGFFPELIIDAIWRFGFGAPIRLVLKERPRGKSAK